MEAVSTTLRTFTTAVNARAPLAARLAEGTEHNSPVIGRDRTVQIWLFGMLARFATERPLVLHLPANATFGQAINTLARRLGPKFAEQVIQAPGKAFNHCRIFADGRQIEDLSETIGGTEPTSNIEMILIMAAEGG